MPMSATAGPNYVSTLLKISHQYHAPPRWKPHIACPLDSFDNSEKMVALQTGCLHTSCVNVISRGQFKICEISVRLCGYRGGHQLFMIINEVEEHCSALRAALFPTTPIPVLLNIHTKFPSTMPKRDDPMSRRRTTGGILTIILTHCIVQTIATDCPVGHARTAENICTPCPPGTTNSIPNAACEPCAAGTYTPFAGVTHGSLCIPCGMNSTSKPGLSECTPCPAGEISSANKCARCAPGTYASAGRCRKCRPDTISADFNSLACSPCPDGEFANDDASGCISRPCIPGRVWSTRTKTCRKCPKNTHRTAEMASCEECPPRRTSVRARAEKTKCRKCPPDTFITEVYTKVSRSGVRNCLLCPPGTTTNGFSKPFCRAPGSKCPVDMFEDIDGDCNLCDVGSRYVPAKKWCARCRLGEAGSGGMSTVCRKCLQNMVVVEGECVCKLGFVFSAGRCRPCPPGTMRASHEQVGCSLCAAGTQASGRGSSECTECAPGWSSLATNGATCVPPPVCEVGTVIPRGGNPYARMNVCVSSLTGCPVGTTRVTTSETIICQNETTSKVLCPSGHIFNGSERDGKCLRCDPGEALQLDAGGLWICSSCPDGMVSAGGLSRQCKSCENGFEPYGARFRCGCGIGRYVEDGVCLSCPEGGQINMPRGCF